MSLFPHVDWPALGKLMQSVKALLREDLVSLGQESPEVRLLRWQGLETTQERLRALSGTLPGEVEDRCRGDLALAFLLLAASFHRQAKAISGVTDRFTSEELELALQLEESKALDVLAAPALERILRQGDPHPVLARLATGQYQRLRELLDHRNVRKDILSAVHTLYRARLDKVETAVKAYLASRVDQEGADRAVQAAGGKTTAAPEIAIYGGQVTIGEVNIDKPSFTV